MTRSSSIIRTVTLCAGVLLLACKPESKVAAVPEATPVVAPVPPRPVRPLSLFVKEALDLHFSPNNGVEDFESYRNGDLAVQLKGLPAADLPAQVHETRLRVATAKEIETALRAAPGDHHPYLALVVGKPDQEGNRILRVGFGALLKTKEGDFEDWASSGCDYVETWQANKYVVVRKNAWVQ